MVAKHDAFIPAPPRTIRPRPLVLLVTSALALLALALAVAKQNAKLATARPRGAEGLRRLQEWLPPQPFPDDIAPGAQEHGAAAPPTPSPTAAAVPGLPAATQPEPPTAEPTAAVPDHPAAAQPEPPTAEPTADAVPGLPTAAQPALPAAEPTAPVPGHLPAAQPGPPPTAVSDQHAPAEVADGHSGSTVGHGEVAAPHGEADAGHAEGAAGHGEDHGEDHGEAEVIGHAPHSKHGEHAHGYICLFFLFGGFGLGCLLQVVQERFVPYVPYTCMLFLSGFGLALIHFFRPKYHWSYWHTWYQSIDMWEEINPHLVLYIFLPALVFAEAMRLNLKLCSRLIGQVLTLACPGVVIGTLLIGFFAHQVFPYGWSWDISMVFGSILSATDPVAVVSLFNTLGVSPKLTLLVSGESLLNDGTAIVLFNLLLTVWRGTPVDAAYVGKYFLQMTVISTFLGVGCATLALTMVYWASQTRYETDAMIQVAVTISTGFLSFFLAEYEVETSGVLTVVSAGAVFAYMGWPNYVNKETMQTVWEFIEFLGNTIIFLLSGLLFGHRVLSRKSELTIYDWGWLLALYAAVIVIRYVMLGVLWPLLNCCGQKVSWKEVVVMGWSGLRGAVGLVLAISVDHDPLLNDRHQAGARIMFHVGGIAMLTIMINATLASPLLRKLGLTKTEIIEQRCIEHFKKATDDCALEEMKQIMDSKDPDCRFVGLDGRVLSDIIPALASEKQKTDVRTQHRPARLRQCREIFMRAVRREYWDDIDEGLLSFLQRVARILLHSTESALDDPTKPLHDWEKIEEGLPSSATPCLSKIVSIWPLSVFGPLTEAFPTGNTVVTWKICAILAFLESHKAAREEISSQFGPNSVLGTEIQDVVFQESQEQCEQAEEELGTMPPATVEECKSRMLKGKLLQVQMDKVNKLQDKGFLSTKGAGQILDKIKDSMRELTQMPPPDAGAEGALCCENTEGTSSDEQSYPLVAA